MIALRSSAACWIAAAVAVALVVVLAASPSPAPTAQAPALQLHERVESVNAQSELARMQREHAQLQQTLRSQRVLEDSIVDIPRHDPGY